LLKTTQVIQCAAFITRAAYLLA